jgi:hypothetical protein
LINRIKIVGFNMKNKLNSILIISLLFLLNVSCSPKRGVKDPRDLGKIAIEIMRSLDHPSKRKILSYYPTYIETKRYVSINFNGDLEKSEYENSIVDLWFQLRENRNNDFNWRDIKYINFKFWPKSNEDKVLECQVIFLLKESIYSLKFKSTQINGKSFIYWIDRIRTEID